CRHSLASRRRIARPPSHGIRLSRGTTVATRSVMENLTTGLAGRVVLVTGGNAGIGRTAAIEFAKQGAKLVVTGRRATAGEEVVAAIKASGGEAIFVRADVSQECDVAYDMPALLDAARRKGHR